MAANNSGSAVCNGRQAGVGIYYGRYRKTYAQVFLKGIAWGMPCTSCKALARARTHTHTRWHAHPHTRWYSWNVECTCRSMSMLYARDPLDGSRMSVFV